MKKIYDLDEWTFDKKIPVDEQIATVSIHIKYIDLKNVIHLTPKERVACIDQHFKANFSKLLKAGPFETYKPIGNRKRPSGIQTTMLMKDVARLARHRFIASIFINSIKGGKKAVKKYPPGFFCIKMTVAIQIEGIQKGLQTYEERYMLIKANSPDEAYKKIESKKKQYEQPYLNADGRLVRWKIESLDDCYSTDMTTSDDLNNPAGIEVFSKLKSRRLTKERYWDGKLK